MAPSLASLSGKCAKVRFNLVIFQMRKSRLRMREGHTCACGRAGQGLMSTPSSSSAPHSQELGPEFAGAPLGWMSLSAYWGKVVLKILHKVLLYWLKCHRENQLL